MGLLRASLLVSGKPPSLTEVGRPRQPCLRWAPRHPSTPWAPKPEFSREPAAKGLEQESDWGPPPCEKGSRDGAAGRAVGGCRGWSSTSPGLHCGERGEGMRVLGGHSSDGAKLLGTDINAGAQAWARCPLGWCLQSTWHWLSLGGQDSSVAVPNELFLPFFLNTGLLWTDTLGSWAVPFGR